MHGVRGPAQYVPRQRCVCCCLHVRCWVLPVRRSWRVHPVPDWFVRSGRGVGVHAVPSKHDDGSGGELAVVGVRVRRRLRRPGGRAVHGVRDGQVQGRRRAWQLLKLLWTSPMQRTIALVQLHRGPRRRLPAVPEQLDPHHRGRGGVPVSPRVHQCEPVRRRHRLHRMRCGHIQVRCRPSTLLGMPQRSLRRLTRCNGLCGLPGGDGDPRAWRGFGRGMRVPRWKGAAWRLRGSQFLRCGRAFGQLLPGRPWGERLSCIPFR